MNRMRTGVEMDVADPDPEVSAKAQRRRFPAEYRLRILKEADACRKPGEVGALLRREGLYSSLPPNSSSAARGGRPAGDARAPPGTNAAPGRPTREAARDGEPPAPAEVAAGGDNHHPPKKVAEILGIPLTPPDDDETD